MRRSGSIAVLTLLAVAHAAPAADPPPAEAPEARLIRAEWSVADRALAAPWLLVSLTAWPIKELVFFLERTQAPTRITDAVTFPARIFRVEEEQP